MAMTTYHGFTANSSKTVPVLISHAKTGTVLLQQADTVTVCHSAEFTGGILT